MDAPGGAGADSLMPRRDDLESILVIGSGPIVIGQACEFDYSGTQACRVLAEEGYRVVLANSNPATIMTDPAMADRTYVEPLDPDVLAAIIERERPDALLPDARRPDRPQPDHGPGRARRARGHGVEVIGATPRPSPPPRTGSGSRRPWRRSAWRSPTSGFAHSLDEAMAIGGAIGYPDHGPAELHPGRGRDRHRPRPATACVRLAAEGLDAIPDQRGPDRAVDRRAGRSSSSRSCGTNADNCVVVCSIENFDPMGVHTGDSITVAPAQTLTDVEYQAMRDAAFACIRRVGVETGGSNVQFAVDPADGRQLVIEMNPRVSRSSALASKATGFPIAKIAARLAVGYRLDEIANDITGATPASFEPTIDYVVTKIPRWAFEKLPGVDRPARHPDAVGGRGDGHRPDLPRVAAEGGPLARAGPRRAQRRSRPRRPTTAVDDDELLARGHGHPRAGLRARDGAAPGDRSTNWPRAPASTRGSSTRWPHHRRRMALDPRSTPRGDLAGLDRRGGGRVKRLGFSDAQLAYLFGRTE